MAPIYAPVGVLEHVTCSCNDNVYSNSRVIVLEANVCPVLTLYLSLNDVSWVLQYLGVCG